MFNFTYFLLILFPLSAGDVFLIAVLDLNDPLRLELLLLRWVVILVSQFSLRVRFIERV